MVRQIGLTGYLGIHLSEIGIQDDYTLIGCPFWRHLGLVHGCLAQAGDDHVGA
jgi:hypothetical protein